ncbi:MAG: PAS domain S-box protein [Deltaproteobacteria bacterium]|jgi:PAS domain S-box-containing protein|nr:PAS domain S-box protein [Deltaproteobacteria bacterium]MBT4268287.1 PAS domain S-box protein [Deltaproteobacteria bacterium]MBT4641361.1 PAS domain S-box protein [Deltaproteobacteria bacterium]
MEKAKILIVEDEAIIAMELESQLRRLGYEVTSIVDTGDDAINKAEEDRPDLILMDIRLKGDKDGIDTAEVIRNRLGIPAIFSTAYLDQERIERAKITMPFGYVLKPIQERDLKVTLEMALYVSRVDTERKKVEEELRLEKEKFQLLYERAPLSYQSLDENGCFIDVNNEWLDQLGYTKEEVIGKSFGDFIHPEWADHFKENFPRFKSMGEILGVEFNMMKKDGSLVLVSFNGKIGYDSEGKFKQTHCIWKDITLQKKAEEELLRSKILLESSIESAKNMIILSLDREYRYLYFNKTHAESMEHAYGTRPQIGVCIFDFMKGQDDIAKVKAHYDRAMIGEGHVANEEYGEDQSRNYFEIQYNPINNFNKEIIGVTAFAQNITDRKQSDELLKESEAKLTAVFENAPDHIMMIDLNGNIKYINRTKYSETKDIVDRSIYDQIPEKSRDVVKKNIELVLKTGHKQRYKIEYETPEGQSRIFASHIGPIKNEGKITGFVLISRDITDQ